LLRKFGLFGGMKKPVFGFYGLAETFDNNKLYGGNFGKIDLI